jgi:hypothetical protein
MAAIALGPIPVGEYKGLMTCSNLEGESIPPQEVTLKVDESKLIWGDTIKEFYSAGNGFVKVLHFSITKDGDQSPLKGLGHGYFTSAGVHFRMMLDLGFSVVEGEDSLFYKDGKIYLVSSAGGYRCEGEFVRVEAPAR